MAHLQDIDEGLAGEKREDLPPGQPGQSSAGSEGSMPPPPPPLRLLPSPGVCRLRVEGGPIKTMRRRVGKVERDGAG
jgi:hypothetical protein